MTHTHTHTCTDTCLVLSCHLAAFKVTLPPQGGDEELDASAFVDLESTFTSEPSLTYCTVYSTALFLDRLGSLTQALVPLLLLHVRHFTWCGC